MNINNTPLENICKFLLQKNVSLEINNKIFKTGKIILFYQKNFFLTFVLSSNKKDKDKVEIPIPYDTEIYEDEGLVYFDYRIKTLCKYTPDTENYLKIYPSKISGNKYWDSILTINTNE